MPLSAFFSLLWIACNKDIFNPNDGPAVTAVFSGIIVDENDAPLPAATVTAGAQTTETDINGVFHLTTQGLSAHNAVLQVRKIGYFAFSRAFYVQHNAAQPVRVRLLRKTLAHSFPATQSTIAQTGGATLHFPANSVVRSDGSAYSGLVSVYARYLDPTDPGLNDYMPGDLRGIAADGAENTLVTFGMIGAELTTPGGEPLRIAPGKEVELSWPIQPEQQAAAPETIALWYYDLETARWMEEGTAQKSGDRYLGKVKHFSFWNCDVGLPLVHLEGNVFLGDKQTPLPYANVVLTVLSNGWKGWGGTNSAGYFGGSVIAGETMNMEIELLNACGEWVSVYSQTVGPFTENTVLPDIVVVPPPAIPMLKISGRLLDCAQKPVANGYVRIGQFPYSSQTIFAGTNGTFDYTLLWCNDNPVRLTAFDLGGVQSSPELIVNNFSASVQLGDISVCNPNTEFVEISIDGTKYVYLDAFEAGAGISNKTRIIGGGVDSGNNGWIEFGFKGHDQTGTFLLDKFQLIPASDTVGSPVLVFDLNTQVKTYGAVGQPIEGTISGTITDAQGQVLPVNGRYHVKRDN